MPEHTPAPSSSRAIYGFVVYLLFCTLFIFYILWAFIPVEIFEKIGVTELPNKYFSLFVPILVLTATTLFAFCIYPGISLCMTPDIDSFYTITDNYTVKRCQFKNADGILCDNKIIHDPLSSWDTLYFCEKHFQNKGMKIIDYCDCAEKEKCLLYQDKIHVEKLCRKESFIKNSADLNIKDVSDALYGQDEVIKKIQNCF